MVNRWHRCSRWTSKKVPCPYIGLEFGFEEGDKETPEKAVEAPVQVDSFQASNATTATPGQETALKGTAQAAAQADVHKLIEDDVSIKERQIATPGPGAVPLWEDDFPKILSQSFETPVQEHGIADLLYANPGGPDTQSLFPLVGILQGASGISPGVLDPLLPAAPRSTQGPGSAGGSYPLIENSIAMAMAGRTPPVTKVCAIARTAPNQTAEQDAWRIQAPVAIVAGAISVAAMQSPVLHPGNVAAHMEKVITKAIAKPEPPKKLPTAARMKVSTGGGPGRPGGMKGGAFQTKTIWEGGIGAKKSLVETWEEEVKRVGGWNDSGFMGTEG